MAAGRDVYKRQRYASAQPQQDNADILQGVVSQQALDVVFHQRIQTTDERGDHADLLLWIKLCTELMKENLP